MPTIRRARADDAEALIELQRAAYAVEARLYDDWTIEPLTETPDDLRAAMQTAVVLVASDAGTLVGSVRGMLSDGTCRIGRLFVRPDRQGEGLGSALLAAIEAEFAGVRRFALFTGSRSEGNIRLYRRHGYVITGEIHPSPKLTLVTLEKSNAP
jgi:GNAT superfamily N-acetyltransferase